MLVRRPSVELLVSAQELAEKIMLGMKPHGARCILQLGTGLVLPPGHSATQ